MGLVEQDHRSGRKLSKAIFTFRKSLNLFVIIKKIYTTGLILIKKSDFNL